MDKYMLAGISLLIAVVISRFVTEAGLKHLSVEQKGHLVEAMSGFRKYALVLWVGFAVLAYRMPLLLVVGLTAYYVAYQLLTLRLVRKLSLPAAYFKHSVAASALVVVGACGYVGVLQGWL